MVTEIRLHIEGGGDGKETRAALRRGFGVFLSELRESARRRSVRWSIVVCGGRHSAIRDFRIALGTHQNALNLLLIDSEGPASQAGPWEHLASQTGERWQKLDANDDQCHLMVQTMEAWIIADVDALRSYYGQRFNANALPRTRDVEQIAKGTLFAALRDATRNTQKGGYHKTRHAPQLLERIQSNIVRSRATYCARLFKVIEEAIQEP